MTTIKNQTIQACYKQPYDNNYDHLQLSQFHVGNFFWGDSIQFFAYLDEMLLTGNELVYYPELAKRLREMGDYPYLKRVYSMKDAPKGIALLQFLAKRVMPAYKAFQKELSRLSQKSKHLIETYGDQWRTPIIDNFESGNGDLPPFLVINGIKWKVESCHTSYTLETIHLRELFNIRKRVNKIWLVNTLIGTPFIALRIRENDWNKGRVYWFSLETCRQVSKKDMEKWRRVHL